MRGKQMLTAANQQLLHRWSLSYCERLFPVYTLCSKTLDCRAEGFICNNPGSSTHAVILQYCSLLYFLHSLLFIRVSVYQVFHDIMSDYIRVYVLKPLVFRSSLLRCLSACVFQFGSSSLLYLSSLESLPHINKCFRLCKCALESASWVLDSP